MTNETSGNYTVEIILEDSLGKSSSYNVTFEILPQVQDEESNTEGSNDD